jgi:MoaA/NifB/PqqE/SkfB family radical SAM enzyme
MFKFEQLKLIQLEITNRCQASCPMCSRNCQGEIVNPLLKLNDWTFNDFKEIITPEVLKNLDLINFCGTYGDPLINNDLLKMCAYAKEINPELSIDIHTNGSLRNNLWWKDLATSLPKNHNVIFGIDGLEDTHHIHRIGTSFKKIISNAEAFIKAGGNAEWHYLIFKHNQHQVNEAKILSQKIGFSKFQKKQSTRFILEPKAPARNKNNKIEYFIEPAESTELKFINKDVIDNWKTIVKETSIDCKSVHAKEVYIDAHMDLYPCCWHANVPYDIIPNDLTYEVRTAIHKQHYEMKDRFGITCTKERSIKDIINSVEYQTLWNEYWTTNKSIVCVRSCGKKVNFAQTYDQVLSESE